MKDLSRIMFHLVFVTETVLESMHVMLQMLREIGDVSGHFNFLSEVTSDVHMHHSARVPG